MGRRVNRAVLERWDLQGVESEKDRGKATITCSGEKAPTSQGPRFSAWLVRGWMILCGWNKRWRQMSLEPYKGSDCGRQTGDGIFYHIKRQGEVSSLRRLLVLTWLPGCKRNLGKESSEEPTTARSPRAQGEGARGEERLVFIKNRFCVTAEKWKEKTWESNAAHSL